MGESSIGTALPLRVPMRIEPATGPVRLKWRELRGYGYLIRILAWRELQVRYKETAAGALWVVLQPLVTTGAFSVLFGQLMRVRSDELPFPLFAFSALVPWTFVVHVLTKSATSLVEHRRLITKVYFPRLAIPIAIAAAGLVDLLVALAVLLVMMLLYGVVPSVFVWTLPLFVLLATALAVGIGLWLAALNVQFRDVTNALPFLVQLWLFLSPIAYSTRLIPEAWRPLYALNPMVGIVEGFRWSLFGRAPVSGAVLAASLLGVLVVLGSGLRFFLRREDRFADLL